MNRTSKYPLVGDAIADLHDGWAQLSDRFKIVARCECYEPDKARPVFDGIYSTLKAIATRGGGPMNKYLYIVGTNADCYVAAFVYDNYRSGIVTLEPLGDH